MVYIEYMSKHNHKHGHGGSTVAEDASALLAATAEVKDEKIEQARDRLSAALESARDAVLRVRDKSVEYAKAADEVVRERPYQALAVSLGLGALLGYLIGRNLRNRD